MEGDQGAAGAAESAAEETGRRAADLLNDFQDISFLEIALVIAGTWLAIVVIRRVVPFLAERGPNHVRLLLLGAVPIARLVLMTAAILWIIPP